MVSVGESSTTYKTDYLEADEARVAFERMVLESTAGTDCGVWWRLGIWRGVYCVAGCWVVLELQRLAS